MKLFLALLTLALGGSSSSSPEGCAFRKCDPYAEKCPACKDCSACHHCHGLGGKCSVCFRK